MQVPANPEQNARTITALLAPVILQTGVPLQAIAAIGDIIALDARLLDYGGDLMKGNSLADLEPKFESYEALVRRASAGLEKFSGSGNKLDLIQLLLAIKDALSVISS
jgi:hypothetical protein